MIDDANDLPEPVDLTPLDPLANPRRADALVAAIVAAGMDARRRPKPSGLVAGITRWSRPALAAAALILAVSIPAIIRSERQLTTPAAAGAAAPAADTTARRFGLPASVIALTQRGRTPAPYEIVSAFDDRWNRGQP